MYVSLYSDCQKHYQWCCGVSLLFFFLRWDSGLKIDWSLLFSWLKLFLHIWRSPIWPLGQVWVWNSRLMLNGSPRSIHHTSKHVLRLAQTQWVIYSPLGWCKWPLWAFKGTVESTPLLFSVHYPFHLFVIICFCPTRLWEPLQYGSTIASIVNSVHSLEVAISLGDFLIYSKAYPFRGSHKGVWRTVVMASFLCLLSNRFGVVRLFGFQVIGGYTVKSLYVDFSKAGMCVFVSPMKDT